MLSNQKPKPTKKQVRAAIDYGRPANGSEPFPRYHIVIQIEQRTKKQNVIESVVSLSAIYNLATARALVSAIAEYARDWHFRFHSDCDSTVDPSRFDSPPF